MESSVIISPSTKEPFDLTTTKTTKPTLTTLEKVILCSKEAAARKAEDVLVLDLAKHTSFADYFVICSGRSSRQVQAIADQVVRKMRESGTRPLHIEGHQQGHWVLVDYGDVIMHIFYRPVRELYDLESLWADAERIDPESVLAVS
jgi:ribosome-associated protein